MGDSSPSPGHRLARMALKPEPNPGLSLSGCMASLLSQTTKALADPLAMRSGYSHNHLPGRFDFKELITQEH